MMISPSILSADFGNLQKDVLEVEASGADMHHIDVMDGHFVPNLSIGLPVIKALKKVTSIPLDVHIMISNPDEMALKYVEAGADLLTFHLEASNHSHRLIQQIKEKGAKAGVAINPATPVALLEPVLSSLDLVLLMSVNPGFGGQKFIPNVLEKIRFLKEKKVDHQFMVSVDGGVNQETAAQCAQAGADALVAGSFVYGSKDRKRAIQNLKGSFN